MGKIYLFALLLFLSHAKNNLARTPDEYQGTLGFSKGFAGAGVAYVTGLDSLRLNPALLKNEKSYKILAHSGIPQNSARSYYTIGILDSFSSKLAVGLAYNNFYSQYKSDNQVMFQLKIESFLVLLTLLVSSLLVL